jgi:hypothetical protein
MNKERTALSGVIFCLTLALFVLTPLIAIADANDPPTRVARLALAEGTISFQPGGTGDWVAAAINRPLTTGDKLWSAGDGRVELQLDGSLLRLSSNTAAAFLNLADEVTQIQLSAGTLLVHVRRLDPNETYEIDTPNLAFSILRPGIYRIAVDESGATTTIRVRGGQGEVTGGGAAYPVHANEYNAFSGTNPLTENAQSAPGNDSFDAWSANRDMRWERSTSARYVSPDLVGYQDLDDHGDWRPTAGYGNVWFPRDVGSGWAPYHNGHWAYIAPWGYTWVDDQPWGFAPFHYGRWISVDGAWGWVPALPRREGTLYARPVYAPALVAWVGAGAAVAWFALGPREVFVPSYPVSRGYVNSVNISNTSVNTTVVNNTYNTTIVNNTTTNVTNVTYVNRGVPGAVTATTTQAFSSAQPVASHAVTIGPVVYTRPVQVFPPPIVPTKAAVLGGQIAAVRPPAAVIAQVAVVKTTPPVPPPTFAARQAALSANGGRPLSAVAVRQLQTNSPAQSQHQVLPVQPAQSQHQVLPVQPTQSQHQVVPVQPAPPRASPPHQVPPAQQHTPAPPPHPAPPAQQHAPPPPPPHPAPPANKPPVNPKENHEPHEK